MEDFKLETISLKRYGAKEWQFQDCAVARVEIAVLDYLKDQGWSGYFTEHENFEELLIKMMCWKDHSNFPWSFDGDIDRFSIQTVNCMFQKAADGYWSYDQKYTRADLLNNAKSFNTNDISNILRLWSQQKIKFGKSKHQVIAKKSWEDLCNLSPNDLAAYHSASGGDDYFLSLLERRFPPELQVLWYRAKKLFDELKVSCREKSDYQKHHQTLMNLVIGFQDAGAMTYLGIASSVHPENLDNWITEIGNIPKSDLVEKYLQLAKDVKTLTDDLGSLSWKQRNGKHAILDLQVWKNGQLASVEVKAPNDRLRPNQKAELLKDKELGHLSWVVNVHDGQINQAAIEIKNDRKVKRAKLKSLADRVIEDKSIPHLPDTWQDGFKSYSKWTKLKGFKQVPKGLIFEGFKLGQWVTVQRVSFGNDKLTTEQEEALNNLGFIWNINDYAWSVRYKSYLRYIKKTGDTQVPKGLIFEDFNLSKWVSKQREAYSNNSIKYDRKRLLNNLGFIWKPVSGTHNSLGKNINMKVATSKIQSEISLSKAPWET